MTRVAVAVATYNGARFVEAQLASIVAQTRAPDEIVVRDDASTDDTASVVRAFASRSAVPLRLIVAERNEGVIANFEGALAACSADVLFLADQDDVWAPQKIARMLAALDTPTTAGGARPSFAFSNARIVDADLVPLGYSLWSSARFSAREQRRCRTGRAFEVLLKHNVATGACVALRSSLRALAAPLPRVWMHDHWLALLAAASGDVVIVDEPLVRYRQHGKNVIGGRRLTWSERIAKERSTDHHTRVGRELDFMRRVRERLHAHGLPRSARDAAHLEAKIAHLEARLTSLDAGLVQRLALVGQETMRGRYLRYSSHPLHPLRDLATVPQRTQRTPR